MQKNLFLLGGYDLEMITIRDLLDQHGQDYRDNHLSWGARLQEYISELREYGNDEEYKIYGIELDKSGVEDIPNNYCEIDHHNHRENEASSLEQVCTLLGIEMDEYYRLVAANDCGYIPAMEKMGATKEEIDIIRRRDRKAQGVTEQEEVKAEEAITTLERIGNVTFVNSPTNRFSPVVDRLYPYDNLVVYSSTEFTFYGEMKEDLFDRINKLFHDEFERLNFRMYSGGGPKGYFGLSGKTREEIQLCNNIIKTMKHEDAYSGHIFLFPFTWENTEVEDPIKGLQIVNNGCWKRVPLPEKKDEILYNELNYFYPFVHTVLYDDEGKKSKTIHFEHDIETGRVKYLITSKTNTFSLDVVDINLNIYETGVGLLCIYTHNCNYREPEDILLINQYGRRLFPPFLDDVDYHIETPLSLEIQGLKDEYKVEYNNKAIVQPNKLPDFIKNLVSKAIMGKDGNPVDIKSMLDDRMFVMSWYKSTLNFTNDTFFDSLVSGDNDYLYKYIFVDGTNAACQNAEMRKALLKEALYSRWQKWGTLYGVSRYSFQMLFYGNGRDFLIRTFETTYVRLLELVLVQRSSILRFSKLLNSVNDQESEFSQIYGQYINYLNKFRLPEVTAQDQGIELYDMLCERLRIREQSEHLDRQFNEREEYLDLQNEKQINKESRKLNILAGFAVPISVISALFGFFFRDSLNATSEEAWRWVSWSPFIPGITAIIITVALTVFLLRYVRRRGK